MILPQASLFLGIIPALILLYIGLKGYEEQYKEKNIFLTFVAGLVAGFITVFIEYLSLGIGLLFIVLFPVLEQMFKVVILNIGRLQKKRETAIYGLSLGLGFGAIFTPFSIILSSPASTNWINIALIVLSSFGIILLHGATGIVIGLGIYSGKLPRSFLLATILHIPVPALIFATTAFGLESIQIALIPYGLILFWYAIKKILPNILKSGRRRTARPLKSS